MNFDTYDPEGFYDELILKSGCPRDCAKLLTQRLSDMDDADLIKRQKAAEAVGLPAQW